MAQCATVTRQFPEVLAHTTVEGAGTSPAAACRRWGLDELTPEAASALHHHLWLVALALRAVQEGHALQMDTARKASDALLQTAFREAQWTRYKGAMAKIWSSALITHFYRTAGLAIVAHPAPSDRRPYVSLGGTAVEKWRPTIAHLRFGLRLLYLSHQQSPLLDMRLNTLERRIAHYAWLKVYDCYDQLQALLAQQPHATCTPPARHLYQCLVTLIPYSPVHIRAERFATVAALCAGR